MSSATQAASGVPEVDAALSRPHVQEPREKRRGGAQEVWPAAAVGGSRLHLPHGTTPAADSAVWVLALSLAAVTSTGPATIQGTAVGVTALAAVTLQTALYAFLLRGRARFGTLDEIPQLLFSDLFIAASLMIGASLTEHRSIPFMPMETAIVAEAIALTGHLASRWMFRRLLELRRRPESIRTRRAIVLGAGYGGAQAVTLMQEDRESAFQPVALLDDDPAKRHLRINGVRVLGPWSALGKIAKETGADLVLLAVPSASPDRVDEVVRHARGLGLDVRVLPSPQELIDRAPARRSGAVSQIRGSQIFRPLEISDLLGRRAIDTDADAICGYLSGARVLVTGAGGSIGSQLCREIVQFSPQRLIMVDRDESALHAVQLALDGEGMLDSPDLVLADLRTPGLISSLFESYQPTIVFHAAALKHLTLTERFPVEAFMTNVVVTRGLLDAAAAGGVQRFINISTDKAADPACVLGYTKRLAERLTSTTARSVTPDRRFISVRFGNVLGSRGSALTTFASQLERGLPMTITDPRMERFFMSVDEACQLVLQAGALGASGEVLVLDMGHAHNIEKIARRFATLLGYTDATVTYTRTRPGEKLKEQLFGAGEKDLRPFHPLISQVPVPPVDQSTLSTIDEIEMAAPWERAAWDLSRWMEHACQSEAVELVL